MKNLLAALIVVACICITSSAMASAGHQCMEMRYTWYGYSEGITYMKLYADGYFQDAEGGWGYWKQFGTAVGLQYYNGCMPLYSGTKKQGFYECTDGSNPISGPNVYMIKKSKNCGSVDAIVYDQSGADGPTAFSPK